MKRGAGAWAQLNDAHLACADGLRFTIDPTRPRIWRDKGKAECRVQDGVGGNVHKREYSTSLEVSSWTQKPNTSNPRHFASAGPPQRRRTRWCCGRTEQRP